MRAGWRAPAAGLVLDVGYRISNDTSRVLSRQIVFVGIGAKVAFKYLVI